MLPYSPNTSQPPSQDSPYNSAPPSPFPPQGNPYPPPPPITHYQPLREEPHSNIGFILTAILIVIILGALIGGGAYFVNKTFNTPKQVKERVELIQPILEDYTKSVKDLGDYLKNDSNSTDTDSMERDVQKGRNLLKTADDNLKTLSPLLEKLDIEEVQKYKSSINDYLPKAKAIVDISREAVDLSSSYIGPLREMETASLSSTGISNYMYSDPDKYVSLVDDLINKMSDITKKLEDIPAGSSVKEYHNSTVRVYKEQVSLLKQVRDAVAKRSLSAITQAQNAYAESSKNLEKETNRISDQLNEKIDESTKETESLREKITSEYNRLRGTYNF